MHILAIRFSSLGDVVLQTPTISWLRHQYPEAKISFLTAKEFTGLLTDHPHLDQIIGMQRFAGVKGLWKLRKFILKLHKKNQFDLIVDLHGTTRSFFIKFFLPFVKSVSVDKRRLQRSLLVKTQKNSLAKTPSIHSRNISDLCAIIMGKKFDSMEQSKLSDFINQNSTTPMPMGLTSTPLSYQMDSPVLQGDYIVLSPVASFASKRWPIESFTKLAQMILEDKDFMSYKVVVLGGPKDNYCEGLKKLESQYQEEATPRFFYLQGKTNLQQTMHYLKYCRLCIGNDTGLNHIAEAHGVPVITIFGPTHESFGFKAHLEHSMNLSVDVKELSCRPCSTTGKKACKLEKQLCMLRVTPELVWEKAKLILNKSKDTGV